MTDAIKSITHNLPTPLRDAGIALLGQECYTTLLYNVDLSSTYCLRLAVSKALGLGIVVFGSIMKLPQIIKITSAKSAKGISLTMYILEVWAYTVSLIYAFRAKLPSVPMERISVLRVRVSAMDMLLLLLIIYYSPTSSLPLSSGSSIRASNRTLPLALASLSMLLLTLYLLSPSLCPSSTLTFLQGTTIPISLLSKIPQILQLNKDKSPGNLSAIVVFAQLLGTLARVFTTATETDDKLLLAGFLGAGVFNGIIAAQYILYWNGNEAASASAGRGRKLE